VKCEYKLGGSRGDITSPGYPSNYPTDRDCNFYITVRKGSKIKLKFSDLDLERTSNCAYDFVRIKDGGDKNSRQIGQYCGQTKPVDIVSSTNKLYIRFKSDSRNTRKGFKISWEQVEDKGTGQNSKHIT